MREFLARWRASVESQKAALLIYLQSKVAAADWHAVADAAMDLRECETQFDVIEGVLDELQRTASPGMCQGDHHVWITGNRCACGMKGE